MYYLEKDKIRADEIEKQNQIIARIDFQIFVSVLKNKKLVSFITLGKLVNWNTLCFY